MSLSPDTSVPIVCAALHKVEGRAACFVCAVLQLINVSRLWSRGMQVPSQAEALFK